jgi:uncharacterized pyridoxal phosphate-containing UPF0001 family protein
MEDSMGEICKNIEIFNKKIADINKKAKLMAVSKTFPYEKVNRYVKEIDKIMKIMLEINIAKEPQKYGFFEEDTEDAFKDILNFKNINVTGLMTIAPAADNKDEIEWVFKDLKNLKDPINKKYSANIKELSVRMSSDYDLVLKMVQQ